MTTIAQKLEEVVKRSKLLTFKETEDFRIYETDVAYGGIINDVKYDSGVKRIKTTSCAACQIWDDKEAVAELFRKTREEQTDIWVAGQPQHMSKIVTGFRFSKVYDSAQLYIYTRGWYEKVNRSIYFKVTREKFITITGSVARVTYTGNRNHKMIRVLSLKNISSVANMQSLFSRVGLGDYMDKYDFLIALLSPMMGKMGHERFLEMMAYAEISNTFTMDREQTTSPIYERKAYIGAETKEDLIKLSIGKDPAKRLSMMFKDDIPTLLAIYKRVRVDQMTKFQQVLYTIPKEKLASDDIFWYNSNNDKIFFKWYKHHLNVTDADIFKIGGIHVNGLAIIRDYLNYIDTSKRKLNLNIGIRRMKLIHDDYHRERRAKEVAKGPKLKPGKEFEILESTSDYTVEFIKDRERLSHESHMMNHCVYTYRDKINRKECGIYSIMYQDKRYTCEINLNQDRNHFIGQIRGYGNSITPPELVTLIKQQIHYRNQNRTDEEFELISKNPYLSLDHGDFQLHPLN